MRRIVKHQARGCRQAYRNVQKFDPNRYKKENERFSGDLLLHMTAMCCRRCCEIIQWKMDYGRYIQLDHPRKCNLCSAQKVSLAYHHICQDCAIEHARCAKCQKSAAALMIHEHASNQKNTDSTPSVVIAASSSLTDAARLDNPSTDNDGVEENDVPSTTKFAFVNDVHDQPELRRLSGLDTRVLARRLRQEAHQEKQQQLSRMRERERRTALRAQKKSPVTAMYNEDDDCCSEDDL